MFYKDSNVNSIKIMILISFWYKNCIDSAAFVLRQSLHNIEHNYSLLFAEHNEFREYKKGETTSVKFKLT